MRTQTQSQMAANISYKIGPTIGSGATAIVSLAANSNSGDLFAIKSSPISHSSLLQKEHKILSSLSSPHIISCLGYDISDKFYNLFLELASFGALSDHAGRLDESKIQSFTRQILLGLSYLHSNGIAHCDVKGRNVLLFSEGVIKLADFGCSRKFEDCNQLVMGTTAFMAPEVLRGFEQGIASDVWSLGCTVVEMATGKSPWEETDIRKIAFSSEIPIIPEWISDKGRDFVSKCLIRDPKERWTVDQLLCHSFVFEIEKRRWISPKSTMEFDIWDYEIEEDFEERLASVEKQFLGTIIQLDSAEANWAWDDSWFEVRGRRENFACSGSERGFDDESNGFEDIVLGTGFRDCRGDDMMYVYYGCEIEAEDRTENVQRCNNWVNDLNELEICYCIS